MLKELYVLAGKPEGMSLGSEIVFLCRDSLNQYPDVAEKQQEASSDAGFAVVLKPDSSGEEVLVPCLVPAEAKDGVGGYPQKVNIFKTEKHPLYDPVLCY